MRYLFVCVCVAYGGMPLYSIRTLKRFLVSAECSAKPSQGNLLCSTVTLSIGRDTRQQAACWLSTTGEFLALHDVDDDDDDDDDNDGGGGMMLMHGVNVSTHA